MIRPRLSPAFQAALVLSGLAALALAWRFLPFAPWVDRQVQPALEQAGPWGPLLFVLLYALATLALSPGTPLTLAGGYLFGPLRGLALVWVGASLGAILAFLLSRTLFARRPLADSPAAHRLRPLDAALASHGFLVVLLLRLAPVIPFSLLNYALGLSSVRTRSYVLGTMLGILPGAIAYIAIGSISNPGSLPNSPAWLIALGAGATLLSMLLLARLALNSLARFSRVDLLAWATSPAPDDQK